LSVASRPPLEALQGPTTDKGGGAVRRHGDEKTGEGGGAPLRLDASPFGRRKEDGLGVLLPESGGFEIGAKMHPVFLAILPDF